MTGLSSYTTAVSVAEAIEFYQNAMAELGYTYSEDDSFVTDDSAILTFNQDGEVVNVSISEIDSETSITVISENQG
jgi:hypothetical protein